MANIIIEHVFSARIDVVPFADGVIVRSKNTQAFISNDDPNKSAEIDAAITTAIDDEIRFDNIKPDILNEFNSQKPTFDAEVEQIKNS